MTTLVTGATGLVGNNTVRALLDRGATVRVLVRANSDPRPLRGLEVEVFQGDVRDASAVQHAMKGVSQVVHSAAYVQIGWSALDQQRAINVEGTRIVAEAARAAGARFVHVSSVDALGLGKSQQPADENTPRNGKVPCTYVVTKREAEDAVRDVIGKGLDGVIVNPGFMVGPWDWKPSSGRMLIAVGKYFIPFAPIGGCSICDVRDVTSGILAALDRGMVGQNYVLAGFNLPYLDIWRLFARVAGNWSALGRSGPAMRIIAGYGGDFIGRVTGREPEVNSAMVAMSSQFHYYNSARAQRELGYQNRPLETTVTDAWHWFKSNGYS